MPYDLLGSKDNFEIYQGDPFTLGTRNIQPLELRSSVRLPERGNLTEIDRMRGSIVSA